MSITRPPSSAIDEQRIAQEVARLLDRPNSEREYREQVLIGLAVLRERFDNFEAWRDKHEAQDDARHITMTQQIGSNTGFINKALGMVALLVALAGLMMWLIDRMSPT